MKMLRFLFLLAALALLAYGILGERHLVQRKGKLGPVDIYTGPEYTSAATTDRFRLGEDGMLRDPRSFAAVPSGQDPKAVDPNADCPT